MGTKWEQNGNMEEKWEQNGNKIGTCYSLHILSFLENGNKMGTKWEQKWEQKWSSLFLNE